MGGDRVAELFTWMSTVPQAGGGSRGERKTMMRAKALDTCVDGLRGW